MTRTASQKARRAAARVAIALVTSAAGSSRSCVSANEATRMSIRIQERNQIEFKRRLNEKWAYLLTKWHKIRQRENRLMRLVAARIPPTRTKIAIVRRSIRRQVRRQNKRIRKCCLEFSNAFSR